MPPQFCVRNRFAVHIVRWIAFKYIRFSCGSKVWPDTESYMTSSCSRTAILSTLFYCLVYLTRSVAFIIGGTLGLLRYKARGCDRVIHLALVLPPQHARCRVDLTQRM